MDMDTDDVAALERNSYRTMDDGLWDLLLGAFLLSFPLGDHFDVPFLPSIVGVLAVTSWKTLRASLSEPRVGFVRLHPARRARLRNAQCMVAIVFALVIAALLGLQALGRSGAFQAPALFRPLAAGLAIAIPLGVSAWLFDVRRMFLYAVVIVVACATGRPIVGFGIAGAVIAASGVAVMLAFRRRYPVTQHGAETRG